jgi:hypothetical protein
MHISWNDYLIYVKCGPMRSHVLENSQMHDSVTYILQMCYICITNA